MKRDSVFVIIVLIILTINLKAQTDSLSSSSSHTNFPIYKNLIKESPLIIGSSNIILSPASSIILFNKSLSFYIALFNSYYLFHKINIPDQSKIFLDLKRMIPEESLFSVQYAQWRNFYNYKDPLYRCDCMR